MYITVSGLIFLLWMAYWMGRNRDPSVGPSEMLLMIGGGLAFLGATALIVKFWIIIVPLLLLFGLLVSFAVLSPKGRLIGGAALIGLALLVCWACGASTVAAGIMAFVTLGAFVYGVSRTPVRILKIAMWSLLALIFVLMYRMEPNVALAFFGGLAAIVGIPYCLVKWLKHSSGGAQI